MHPFIADLRFAQQTKCAVELHLYGRFDKILTGVIDIDEEHELVTIYDPQHFGDTHTRRRIALNDISSVTVLADMEY